MSEYFIYLMTNNGRTTLYTGVTNCLLQRVSQHRQEETRGFSQRYNTNRLVYYEKFNDIRDAIMREKQLKGWARTKKEGLIRTMNPTWTDLAESILGLGRAPSPRWQDRRGWHARDPSASSG